MKPKIAELIFELLHSNKGNRIKNVMDEYVPFAKYTVLGNDFIVVDETEAPHVNEENKSQFARLIMDAHFGVGCDNLLFVQRLTPNLIAEIARVRQYSWTDPPLAWLLRDDSDRQSYVFRMFEADGQEAAMCGNGLIAVSRHLNRLDRASDWTYLTELPTPVPRVRVVSCVRNDSGISEFTVHFGPTQFVSEYFLAPTWDRHVVSTALRVEVLPPFAFLQQSTASEVGADMPADWFIDLDGTWNGYLVSAGEPHLILLPRWHDGTNTLYSGITRFFPVEPSYTSIVSLRALGLWLNSIHTVFPRGINVCMAHVLAPNTLEMRSFERGILHETFACGTGAVAMCAAAFATDLVRRDVCVTVRPYLTKFHQPGEQQVTYREDGWSLAARAEYVFSGAYPRVYSTGDNSMPTRFAESARHEFFFRSY